MRLLLGLVAVALLVGATTAPDGVAVAASGATVAPDSPACAPRGEPVPAGLELVEEEAVTPRLRELTFASRALDGRVGVNVLVPEDFDPSGETRYPVLYLLHGHGGDHTDWAQKGAVAEVVGDRPLIVVMPDGGVNGWYSDWYGRDVDGHVPAPAPAWESFHLRELTPWVDAHLPTVAGRAGRAVAGLSMGGFGAMSYAARHPDRFVAAGSFSGAVHTTMFQPLGPLGLTLTSNLPDGQPPDSCIWGDPLTQEVRWRAHDPTRLAGNLAHLGALYLATGNGVPAGEHDDPTSPNVGGAATENGVWQMNQMFHRELEERGIAHTTDFYGAGTHDWAYWRDDLADFLELATAAFADPAPSPPATAFDFQTAEPRFAVWGWTFAVDRAAREFLYLEDVDARGLTVTGSGTVAVETAPLYRPRSFHAVTDASGSRVVRADPRGRLVFSVDLGPAHRTQQYVFGPAARAAFTTVEVDIAPACHPRRGATPACERPAAP